MKFKPEFLKDYNLDDDHFYNLTEGGYLDPVEALVDQKEADEVKKAAAIVFRFISELAEQAEAEQQGDDE